MNFLENVIARAKSDKKTIVLAEGNDIRTIRAAASALAQGIAHIIILGDIDEICKMANEENLNISEATLINPVNDERFDDFANKFYEMRKAKGMTPEKAVETMKNTLYFGCMMVKQDYADGMVAGACHASADVLRAALQIVRTAPGTKLVSSFFIECVPNCEFGEEGVFLFSDCALNENPDAEQLSEIAISSAKSFRALLDREPRVAMTSYSSYGSAKSEMVDKVKLATQLAKEKAPDLVLDGELQADASIVPSVGASKAPGSPVAGKANVLIFPDINVGNICYKLVERLAKAEAYGPVTQGIAKPVNDLSRGCKAEDIVGVIAITCVQAQANK